MKLKPNWSDLPIIISFAVIGFVLGANSGPFVAGIISAGAAGIGFLSVHFLDAFLERSFSLERARLAVVSKAESLQEDLDQNFFTNLVKINFKYIDAYYLQTQVQANKSFILAASAAVVALATVVTGIVLMYFERTQAAYVATGSGALGELIAGVFFYLYNRTVLRMGEYHQKLVITQNIALALKIAQELAPEARTEVQSKLIENLSRDVNYFLSGRSEPELARTRSPRPSRKNTPKH